MKTKNLLWLYAGPGGGTGRQPRCTLSMPGSSNRSSQTTIQDVFVSSVPSAPRSEVQAALPLSRVLSSTISLTATPRRWAAMRASATAVSSSSNTEPRMVW